MVGIVNSRGTLEQRFWAKVRKGKPNECWPWQASVSDKGHGILWMNGRLDKAHRVSWVLHKGPIPKGKWVLHHCDNPPCVNPRHLFLGNSQANVDDSVAKDRHARGERRHNAKLTAAQVIKIRKAKGKGRDIAKAYGISEQHVCSLRKGRFWSHLNFPTR